MIAYCRAHVKNDTAALEEIEQDLLNLQTLLDITESDDVDVLQATADENYKQAFEKYDGGIMWHFHQETDPTAVPTDTEIQQLAALNIAQQFLSGAQRELANVQWKLFAFWWTYCSGLSQHTTTSIVTAAVTSLKTRLSALSAANGRVTQLQTLVDQGQAGLSDSTSSTASTGNTSATNSNGKAPQQGTNDRFNQQKDNTAEDPTQSGNSVSSLLNPGSSHPTTMPC